MQATGAATDPFDLDAEGVATISEGAATGVRTIRRSFFENRVTWGSTTDKSIEGPGLAVDDFIQVPVGPVTLGTTLTMMRDCRITGVRIYKHPAATGSTPVGMWDATGTLLASKTVTWEADGGGWREIAFDVPVNVTEGDEYSFGYHHAGADSHYAASPWVWNNGQDTTVYPFLMRGHSATGSGVKSGGSWNLVGGSLAWTGSQSARIAANYYIDVIAEWETDLPGYVSGTTYFEQWENSGLLADPDVFPVMIDWPDPQWIAGYKALGFNLMATGVGATEDYIAAVKAAEIAWMPSLHGDNMSAPKAVSEDPELAALVPGYFITDEPEFISGPWNSPATCRSWRNHARLIDSTRPMWINLSRIAVENQGFFWQPVGISAHDKELQWREYMQLGDVGSLDAYTIAGSDTDFDQGLLPGAHNRYGIWCYPLQIGRVRELMDDKLPAWGVVESTCQIPNRPTPTEVKRATWAQLIAGARGIVYFDHRFADNDVTQDFAASLHNAPMAAALTALIAQTQTLAHALLAPDAGLIESYESTGTLAAPQGGLAQGATLPMHYTSRLADETTFIFAQAIRSGTTTATFFAPSLAGATLTVIDEARTVDVDEDGFFSDDFDDGDYTHRLYSTDQAPVFTAPANTDAPELITDGTPQAGETIACAPGAWTGVPSPTFTFQWQRSDDAGDTWTDIAGATASGYTLQEADVDLPVRCTVTAANAAGSQTADSDTATPTAGAGPSTAYADALTGIDDAPAAWWRLLDLTDTSGNSHTLTAAGDPTPVTGLIGDVDEGAMQFSNDSTQTLSVADAAALRLTAAFTVVAWIKPGIMPANYIALRKHLHYQIGVTGSGFVKAVVYTSGGFFWELFSTTTIDANTVHMVAVTYDGTTARLYIDGTEEDNVATEGTPNADATHVCIGKDLDSGNAGWFGVVDEVSLHALEMTAGDISDLYDAGAGA